jgi:hypothetical protein
VVAKRSAGTGVCGACGGRANRRLSILA